MNITLTVVVAAIVILITALVVITIFGSGMTQVGGIAQAKSVCESQAAASCAATNQCPLTWNTPTIRDSEGKTMSCADSGAVCPCATGGNGGDCTVSPGCMTPTECEAAGGYSTGGSCPNSGDVCCYNGG